MDEHPEYQAGEPELLDDEGCEEALELLSFIYDYADGEAYGADYPTVFGGSGSIWGLRTKGRCLSVAAALPGMLGFKGHTLPLLRVGSVATDPKMRGRGLAGLVLEAIHQGVLPAERGVSCLWAAKGGLYERAGYVPVGGSLIVHGGLRERAPFRPGLKIALKEAPIELWSQTVEHQFGPELMRSPGELAQLLRINPMVAALGIRKKQVVAWALMGKGRDMAGIVHDWGGEHRDLLPLLQTLQGHPGFLGILTPIGHPILDNLVESRESAPVCWMKILGRERLLAWAEGLGIGNGLSGLEDSVLLRTLFGHPSNVSGGPTGGRLPFFIWGLDSI